MGNPSAFKIATQPAKVGNRKNSDMEENTDNRSLVNPIVDNNDGAEDNRGHSKIKTKQSLNGALSERHRQALAYARQGMPVFPVIPGGKKPIYLNGHYDATCDPAQIGAWWSKTPDANIGFDPHSCDWCVVDVDAGADPEWVAKLPDTYTIGSPNDGAHHYFTGSL